jgi:hypothetical protein
MATTCRQVILGQTVVLEIDIYDARGTRLDADSVPAVEIIDSNGNVVRPLSATNVVRIQDGRYRLNYTVPSTAPTGIWVDHWRAQVNGFITNSNLSFIVLTAAASIDAAGSQIGDDPVVNWTEAEIQGINILMHQLRCRLHDFNLKHERLDEYGNLELVDCPIFTDDELLCFLCNSLSEFNQTPHFTDLGFDSPIIYSRNAHVIVEGAFIMASAAKMLIEAGREFSITDNGISMSPPQLSSVLNNELGHFLNPHLERLKQIKWSMKPAPTGFGSFRVLAVSPNFMRLRHLRQRRIVR